MNALTTYDGLASIVSGAGTSADKRMHQFYTNDYMSWQQIDAMYRTSWAARKLVDLPASEMTREKRDWQAEGVDISKLEEAERKFAVWAKLEEALRLSRLGGSVLIMGVKQGMPSQPLKPEALGPNCLQYLHVMSRHEITVGEIDRDPASANYGCPLYYEIMGNTDMVRIDPSRVIAFTGDYVPKVYNNGYDGFWGASILQTAKDAIKNFDSAMNGFASLIEEASIDVYGIPDMLNNLASPEYEARLARRLTLANTSKSTHRALIKDAAETWEQHQVNWAGMPDLMTAFATLAASCGSMPATVFLGTPPKGLNATGESDLQNWYRTLDGWRESNLRPALDKLDPVLKAHAGITGEVWWEFGSLYEESDTVKATAVKAKIDAIAALITAGGPSEPLLKAGANVAAESGLYPGLDEDMGQLEQELAEMPSAAEQAAQEAEAKAQEAALTAQANGGTGAAV